MPAIPEFAFPILGFFVGSIPFGYVIARTKGIDIRQHGSGNIGATNVLRVVGKPQGIVCFVLDFLKGWLPVLLAVQAAAAQNAGSWPAILTALAAILGHNYSPWVGFKGGKGVATSAGALLGLYPIALVIGLITWYVVLKTSRYVSVASMTAAACIPVAVAAQSAITGQWDRVGLGFSLFIGALAILRHRSNIRKLLDGTENRLPDKKSPQA